MLCYIVNGLRDEKNKKSKNFYDWYVKNCYYNRVKSLGKMISTRNIAIGDDLIENSYNFLRLFEKISCLSRDNSLFSKIEEGKIVFEFKISKAEGRLMKIYIANALFVIFVKYGLDEKDSHRCQIKYDEFHMYLWYNFFEEEAKTLQAVFTDVSSLIELEKICVQYFYENNLISEELMEEFRKGHNI